ncbi:unnamed protein product [Ilex paraguariensis]|uniref:Amino acid transporter transmembrane domain-containing protein n=1 Tax=Ilex paraguariensis TaxID=185542 RepID=A0ABC8UF12_9AQUA
MMGILLPYPSRLAIMNSNPSLGWRKLRECPTLLQALPPSSRPVLMVSTLYQDSMAFKTGFGILSIPYALASEGWLSLILLIIIAIATFYTALLMQRCMDADQSIRSYPDIVERAFGTKGRTFASIVMNVELYLIVTSFLIVEGDNLVKIFSDMGIQIGGFRIGGRVCFVIIVGLIILPTERGTLLNWKGLPTAVSLYSFCYCAHPVFPTLYTSMKSQRLFSNVKEQHKTPEICDQHYLGYQRHHCSPDHPLFRVSRVTCWSTSKCRSFNFISMLVISEDFRNLPET